MFLLFLNFIVIIFYLAALSFHRSRRLNRTSRVRGAVMEDWQDLSLLELFGSEDLKELPLMDDMLASDPPLEKVRHRNKRAGRAKNALHERPVRPTNYTFRLHPTEATSGKHRDARLRRRDALNAQRLAPRIVGAAAGHESRRRIAAKRPRVKGRFVRTTDIIVA